MGVGAVVSHRAIIDDIGAPIRPEPDIGRAVEPGSVVGVDERLIAGVVASKPLDLERQRLVVFRREVDQLDLVSDFRGRVGGVWRRKPEISLEDVKGGTNFDRPADKGPGREVDPGERRVRCLDRQW